MIKLEYRLLVYKKIGKPRLIRRFRNYWRMAQWLSKIAEKDLNNYYYKKQKIK